VTSHLSKKSSLAPLTFCLIFFTFQSAWANDTIPNENIGCSPAVIPSTATPQLYDAYPYKFLTKNWSTSDSMVNHFNEQKLISKELQGKSQVNRPVSSIRFAAAGDIMRMPSEQKHYVDNRLNQHLESFDIVFANLETLVSPNFPVPPDNLFLMNSDPSVLSAFQRANNSNIFSAVSIANNHTFDFPDLAIEDTIEYLNKLGVKQSGIQESEKPYVVIEKNGIRVGYYAITTFVNSRKTIKDSKLTFNPILHGIALRPYEKWETTCSLDYSPIQKAFSQMDNDNIDFKVISLHWGFEHHMYPQPQQIQVAREIMRQGWDIVIGAHTHTIQPAEVCFFNGYEKNLSTTVNTKSSDTQCIMNTKDGIPRKSITYYSLGNLTSYTPVFWQQVGAIAELELEKGSNGQTDWHSPKYTYTYDHTFNPPNGKQFLTLFDEQGIKCPWESCVKNLEPFLEAPKKHMEEAGFTLIEQWAVSWRSAIHAISAFFHWFSYEPPLQKKK